MAETRTFADLTALGRTKRCAGCGTRIATDAVTLSVSACRAKGRPQTEWLFRRSVAVCESCAIAAVAAALEAVNPGSNDVS